MIMKLIPDFSFTQNALPKIVRITFCCLFCIFLGLETGLAQTILTGKITDAATHDPLPFASIAIVNHNEGGLTDTNGFFRIQTSVSKGMILISATGYESRIFPFTGSHKFPVALVQSKSVINEITIKAEKKPYHNKNNPAVELIRQVIAHKDENRLSSNDHVQYREYDKSVLSFENPGKLLKDNFISNKYKFVFNNIDTTTIIGKRLLPLFIEENIYHKYEQQNPLKKQSVLIANKRVNLDKKYVNNESLGKILQFIYQDIDLYENNIFILNNNFLSPVAPLAPQFYRYYITDTVTNKFGQKTIKLAYEPRNSHDMLFYGILYITLNGHYSITKANVSLPKLANISWVNSFHSFLQYAPDSSGKYYLKESRTGIEFGVGLLDQGVYGERTKIISDFDTHSPIPDSVFKIQTPLVTPDSIHKSDNYWAVNRPDSLSQYQQQVYTNMDSLHKMASFRRLISWVSFVIGGYKNIGSVEIGPWSSFYSYNPVEGFKPRFGGRTTSAFNKNFYFEGNVAYGFNDQRLKYYGSAAYSFNKQNIFWGYPQHYFQISTSFDSRIPGRDLGFNDESNIFLSLKRGENNRYLYNRVLRLDYVNELIPNLRFDLQFERWQQEAAGGLYFVADQTGGTPDTLNSLTTSGIGLDIRWAPHEKFLSGRTSRTSLPGKYPIIEAQIKTGIQGFAGGEFNYQQFRLNIQKRFYLSRLGYADVFVNGGYLAGKVPYPLLFIPKANQTYNYQVSSYNLMNYLEFISDHYASVTIDYHMQGLLLNNIPLIQWLRLREVVGFKAIYGGLRPENASELLALPKDEKGRQATFAFGSQPYMEFNVGIENILNVIRIDYVRRLSYLNHPGISKNGIRLSITTSF